MLYIDYMLFVCYNKYTTTLNKDFEQYYTLFMKTEKHAFVKITNNRKNNKLKKNSKTITLILI